MEVNSHENTLAMPHELTDIEMKVASTDSPQSLLLVSPIAVICVSPEHESLLQVMKPCRTSFLLGKAQCAFSMNFLKIPYMNGLQSLLLFPVFLNI